MSLFPKEWSFLTDAWKFALVLTGREAEATALVSGALSVVLKRMDLNEGERTKRVLFSILCRDGARVPVSVNPTTPAEQATFFLHQLPEPSRQAITLLCLGTFSGEHLAGLLEMSETELARCLDGGRTTLKQHLAPRS